jgi:DNA helicase-2/ATP-dependent DNA helicase PcrA
MQLFITDPLLEGLNEEQTRAVTTIGGPVQVVASAGSGKTTVLTRRIAYMLNEGIKPSSILAVTFTKKAATEMISRLKQIVSSKKSLEAIAIGTYHSLFLEILKPHYNLLGFTGEKPPSICLENRQRTIIRTVASEVNSPFLPEEISTLLGMIKNMGIYPEEFANHVSKGMRPVNTVNEEDLPAVSQLYTKYQYYLMESNLIDFDDILMLTRKLLQTQKEVREAIQKKYKYILVDEFQDVNQVQYDITRLLAAPENNLFVVGDDAQSIYQFRGSDVNIILDFHKDFSPCQVIKLERNYRCSPDIIDLSNKLIKFNREQIPKTVKAVRPNIPDSVNFNPADDVTEESFNLAKQIKGYLLKGIKPEEIAILYRSHSQVDYLEEDLIGWNIPYVIHRNGSFYDLPEIQDLFACLYLARGNKDDLDHGFERAFRAMGIHSQSAEIIRNHARNNSLNMLEACMQAMNLKLHPGQKALADRMVINIIRWQNLAETTKVADLIKIILESSGYLNKLETKGTESAYNSINNLSLIHERAAKWECNTITDLFKAIEQQEIRKKENKGKKQAVQLMTIHTSKGMEFDVVFLVGLEEDILPHKKSVSTGNISEERRLCYVAVTRARKYLNLSRAEFRNRFGKRYKTVVSRFWQEITDQVTM